MQEIFHFEVPRTGRIRSTRYKSITRLDGYAKALPGYRVRIVWKGESYMKDFADAHCDGRLGALADAVAWRDATEARIGKPRTDAVVVSQPRPSNTGIQGVRWVEKSGNRYAEATWLDADGKMHRRYFNVKQHGESKALKLAKKMREQGNRDRLGIIRKGR